MIIDQGKLRETHLSEIFQIECTAYGHLAWSLESLKEELENPLGLNWCVRIKNEIIGYMFCRLLVDEIHLINIAVSNDWQKRGIGRRLMENLISYARAEKFRKIFLEVRSSNSAAVNFYKSLNFQKDFESSTLYQVGSTEERSGIRMSLVLKP